jgi:hypothetical protein
MAGVKSCHTNGVLGEMQGALKTALLPTCGQRDDQSKLISDGKCARDKRQMLALGRGREGGGFHAALDLSPAPLHTSCSLHYLWLGHGLGEPHVM